MNGAAAAADDVDGRGENGVEWANGGGGGGGRGENGTGENGGGGGGGDGDDEIVMFNVPLAKMLGLHHMLAGRNAYHALVTALSVYMCLMAVALCASGLRALGSGDDEAAVIGTASEAAVGWYFFACYKMLALARCAPLVRDCLRAADTGFTRCGRRAGRAERLRWRDRSVWSAAVYAAACAVTVLFYVAGPLAFGDRTVAGRDPDGTAARYRVNVLNLYVLAPARVYNAHYAAAYAAESAVVWVFGHFFAVFDVLLITLCLALSFHLRAVNAAFRSLSVPAPRAAGDKTGAFDTDELQKTSANQHRMVYNEIISIIKDHQMVLRYVGIFFSIFQIILPQIVVASNLLIVNWFIITKKFVDGKMQADSSTLQMIFACPILSFQIYMTCYSFEYLHKQKESVIFALYSSHWTEMDLKCKKLILLTMKMNNAHKQKLKFTQMRIVNLDLFFRTMRICYSVVSMMLKYKSN